MVEVQCHNDCSSTSGEFLNVDKSVPSTVDQPTSLDGPGPSSKHMVDEEKQKTEEI
jgi:hypothetical protein